MIQRFDTRVDCVFWPSCHCWPSYLVTCRRVRYFILILKGKFLPPSHFFKMNISIYLFIFVIFYKNKLQLRQHPPSLSSLWKYWWETMPYCNVGTTNNGIKIFYRTYGGGPVKVLMIIGIYILLLVFPWINYDLLRFTWLNFVSGLAGTHDSWKPQIEGLVGTTRANDIDDNRSSEDGVCNGNGNGIEICVFDNRGMGRSSIPKHKSEYTYVSLLSFQSKIIRILCLICVNFWCITLGVHGVIELAEEKKKKKKRETPTFTLFGSRRY